MAKCGISPTTGYMDPKKRERLEWSLTAVWSSLVSLNRHLLQGPDQTNDLIGIFKFRQEPIALMCDIEGMFHQVHQGHGMTHNCIRSSGFWIIGGSSVICDFISKCISCQRLRGPLQKKRWQIFQKTAYNLLPPFHITPLITSATCTSRRANNKSRGMESSSQAFHPRSPPRSCKLHNS